MGGDDRCAVVRVIRNRSNVPVHAEVLAENGVVRFARFPAKVFDVFGKKQNAELPACARGYPHGR